MFTLVSLKNMHKRLAWKEKIEKSSNNVLLSWEKRELLIEYIRSSALKIVSMIIMSLVFKIQMYCFSKHLYFRYLLTLAKVTDLQDIVKDSFAVRKWKYIMKFVNKSVNFRFFKVSLNLWKFTLFSTVFIFFFIIEEMNLCLC